MTATNYETSTDEITLGLNEGEQTQVTERIQKLADSLPGEGLAFLKNASDYLQRTSVSEDTKKRLKEDKSFVFPDLFARTADEILEPCPRLKDGRPLINGCTDRGKVFRALCLAKGIPSVLVDTLNANYLEAVDKVGTIIEPVRGHVFVDVCIEGAWRTVSPASYSKPIRDFGDYTLGPDKYMVIGRGLDTADLGYRNSFEFRSWLQDQLDSKSGSTYAIPSASDLS